MNVDVQADGSGTKMNRKNIAWVIRVYWREKPTIVYWSNDMGWVGVEGCEKFSEEEKRRTEWLPHYMDGFRARWEMAPVPQPESSRNSPL